MSKVKITFPDGSVQQYDTSITPAVVAAQLGGGIAKNALAAVVNESLVDLSYEIDEDAQLRLLTAADEETMEVFWHSSSHVMAHAIKNIFPEAKFGIGPAIDAGFYYDVEVGRTITPEDLIKIEDEMRRIVARNEPFKREELSKKDAVALFTKRDETYKLDLLEKMEESPRVYWEGDFVDLCRGPHLPSTGAIKHFKLLSLAGAYWHGDERNPMLQRVYGISFPKKSQLDDYLKKVEEAKQRDHRKLGKELDLYSISDDIGPGLILWHPKGALVRYLIENFWQEEHFKHDYELINSPHIAKLDLWDISGHLDFYKEGMFAPNEIDEVHYQLKPMNCPFHLVVYKNRTRSYRDLPIRWAELGTVYRYERSGVLHGLMRVRGFTQDDAHIFVRPDQLEDEIVKLLDFTMHMLSSFGFSEYDIFLSTRPEKFVGTVENWGRATEALKAALEVRKIEYEIDPGEGVFYGPKIDIKIKDVLGRSWQCTTIQVDFNEPERFDLNYIGDDNKPHRPIMIHRALLGSLERFFGIMIEHYAGAFPIWLAPVQAVVLPVSEHQLDYARKSAALLKEAGIRAEVDVRSEKIGFKIRDAETSKIPYMLIVGGKEEENNTVSVRRRNKGEMGQQTVNEFITQIVKEIERKVPQ